MFSGQRVPEWKDLRKRLPSSLKIPPAGELIAGSLVFSPPKEPPLGFDVSCWWTWTPGANWRHPDGPGSNICGRKTHPVVQVAYEDAVAYAKWANKRLPTEAEWEFAARGGLHGMRYAWGPRVRPGGRIMANVWQGRFPSKNTKEDGFERTAPVKSFPPNHYDLYDMIGNVWEWCADWYDSRYHEKLAADPLCSNPTGPERSISSRGADGQLRVIKGGSFLCSENYCTNYRPSARRGMDDGTGMSNIGFRCVKPAY